MTIAALTSVFAKAQTWSEEDQLRLAHAAELIESQHAPGFDVSADDWLLIEQRAVAARGGDIASEEETAAFFARYRTT